MFSAVTSNATLISFFSPLVKHFAAMSACVTKRSAAGDRFVGHPGGRESAAVGQLLKQGTRVL